MINAKTWTKSIAIGVSIALATAVAGPMASAAPVEDRGSAISVESFAAVPEMTTSLGENAASATFGDGTCFSVFNAETQEITVTKPDGTEVTIPVNDLVVNDLNRAAGTTQARLLSSTTESMAPAKATLEGFGCNVLVWFVGLIAESGWSVAVTAAIAMGAVGAALVAAVMVLGTSFLFNWVSTKCK